MCLTALFFHQKDDFYFAMRSKRPPLDRVNAMLSFLYTIFTREYAAALESVGLDSYMGFYHSLRPGRESLACDLVEEGRCIVERFVLTLINLKIIKPEDFDVQVSGAVFLNDDGRKKVHLKMAGEKTYRYDTSVFEGKNSYGTFAVCAKYVACKICAW